MSQGTVDQIFFRCDASLDDNTSTFMICSFLILGPFIIGFIVHFVAVCGVNKEYTAEHDAILEHSVQNERFQFLSYYEYLK